jgi:tetratricopeptide (TPR) repeat protein
MRRAVPLGILCLGLGICAAVASAEGRSPWTLSVAPSVDLPLAAGDFSGASRFGLSWGGGFGVEYSLGAASPLSLRLGAAYTYSGMASYEGVSVSGSLSEMEAFTGLGYEAPLGKVLGYGAFAEAGGSYGSLSSGESDTLFLARLGCGLRARLGSALTARLDLVGSSHGLLYAGLGTSLGFSYALPANVARPSIQPIEILDIGLKSVFPVLRSFYDKQPLGSVKIKNRGTAALEGVKVSFLVKQYMDAPKECAVVARLEPGASVDLPIYGVFNDRILDVTEATKVAAEVLVDYGADAPQTRSSTLLVYDRAALTWNDNRKAASFVSDKDPWVLSLSGGFMAAVRDKRNAELGKNLQTAIAVHSGLRVFGLGYMLSTTRPFEQAVVDPEVVDTLKFPRQTLAFKSGDCADLSVLYASCLEAAGVETAFVTIPGHIFIAADLGMLPAQAAARGIESGLLIEQGGRAWLPIETTMRDSDFMAVWRKGAEEWREASAKGRADFYPMHEAWRTYAPMGLPADGTAVAVPPGDKVQAAFLSDAASATDVQLAARLAALGGRPSEAKVLAAWLNDRGVVQAKYGRMAGAKRDFEAAVQQGSASALVNLGNVAMLSADPAGAFAYYQRAEKAAASSAAFYTNFAKVAVALGRQKEADQALEKARQLEPGLSKDGIPGSGDHGLRAAQADEGGLSWF